MAGSKRVEPWQTPEWRSHCAAERQKFRDGLFYQLMAPIMGPVIVDLNTRPAPSPRKASGAAAPEAEATARVIPLTRNKLCIPCSVTQTPRRPWLGGLALSKATLESVICNEGLCTPGKETYAVASKASSAFIFSRTAL